MRIAIFGAGGAAGYFGARLAEAGEDVIFIARGPHLQAIREQGLQLESVKGDMLLQPAQADDSPAAIGPVDVVIVGVKTWQVAQAAEAMRPLIGPDTIVLPLQNGVEAPEQLAAALGREHVLGGLANIFSYIAAPGHIRHIGGPALITFGELDQRPSRRVARLRDVFARTPGIAFNTPENIHVAIWEKFLFVAPLGGVGTVTRAPVGVFRELPQTRQMLMEGMCEIKELAQANKVALADDIVARTMAFVDSQPPNATTSLQRDIVAGRPSELAAWSGAAVRLGQQFGVATPLHTFVYYSLLPQELRAQGQLQFLREADA